MDSGRFDALVRRIGGAVTRRGALAALLAGLAAPALPGAAAFDAEAAAKQGRGKNRGQRRNGGGKARDAKRDKKRGKSRKSAVRAEAACCSTGACTPGPGKNLGKCCYQGQNLSGKNFSGANLGSANFTDATLTGANLQGANAGKACFVDAVLTGVRTNGSTNLGGAIYCRTQTDTGENNSGCGLGTACCPTCDDENPCEDGQVCCNGRCRNFECCGTGQQSTCPSGQTCCGNACFDLDDDIDNCGACGNACDPDGECIGGDCFGPVMDVILSGGTNPTASIFVDDDLRVELNGQVIFNDNNGLASSIPPIGFQARNGDQLRIVATDALAFCHGLDPLFLHAAVGGAVQTLDAVGVPLTCPGVAVGVFYDETFTIAL